MGRYVLERLLGEGATGRVFAAVQKNPRRAVAIKLLRPGLQSHKRTTERFLREAELLAKLDHPGIARVFESGIAVLPWGPQAFIAMELIDGMPLTEFAARQKLSIAAKLDLLAKVCDAVEYSHAHGVIHRDLKPSNVLVLPDGQPRVLDFGVAHAIYDETGTQPTLGGDLVGTLAYMCPEYASGSDQGGTHCDVYSLGVMAYELISGFRPVNTEGVRLWDAVRAIREHRFPSLRQREPDCGIDLDLVVDKALRADPADRYQTAAAFAADLRRVLENRPVSVRRPTPLYRFGRLLRRTPRRTIAAGMMVAVVFVGGGLSVRQWLLTSQRLQEAKLTLDYTGMLPRHRPGVTSEDATAEALSTVSRLATAELRSHPTVEADVQYRIGLEYLLSLGRYSEAERLLQRANELSSRKGVDDPLVWDVRLSLAAMSAWRDNAHVSEKSLIELIDVLTEKDDEPLKLYLARRQLAWQIATRGPSDALDVQVDALQTLARRLGDPYVRTWPFDASCIRASALYYAGQAAEAERLMPSVDAINEGLAKTPWDVAYRNAAHLGAFVQMALGRNDVAQELLENVLRATISEFGPKSFEVVTVRSRLAGVLWLKGEIAASEQAFAEIVALTGPDGLDDPTLRGNALNSRGVCLRDLGRLEEAEAILNEALRLRMSSGGPEGMAVAATRLNLAGLYMRLGRGSEALACAQEAARIRQVRDQWTPPRESESMAMIGRAKMLIDGPAAALEDLQRAWQVRWDAGLLANWQTDVAVEGLLEALLALDRRDEAQRIVDREYAKLVETAGAENAATKRAAERRAMVVQRSGQTRAATTGG